MDQELAAVGSIVRTKDGLVWRVQMVGGPAGAARYVCVPLDHLVREKRYLSAGDFTVVPRKGGI